MEPDGPERRIRMSELERKRRIEELFGFVLQRRALEKQLDQIKREENALRQQVMADMRELGMRRYDDAEGEFQIVLTRRKNVVVDDEEKVRAELEEIGMLSQSTRLDLPTVKRLAREYGLSGLREEESWSLTLTPSETLDHDPNKIVRLR
jgi:hypothetical protein